MTAAPTAAERAALAWIVDRGLQRFGGSALAEMYARRWREQHERDTGEAPQWTPGLGRNRAWWRTGGAVCARLAKKGLLREEPWGHSSYSPEYSLTPEGERIGREAAP